VAQKKTSKKYKTRIEYRTLPHILKIWGFFVYRKFYSEANTSLDNPEGAMLRKKKQLPGWQPLVQLMKDDEFMGFQNEINHFVSIM
jgi:hypothetical protein